MRRSALVFSAITLLLCAYSAGAQETASVPTQRVVQFENDEVKVWKSIVAPNSPLPPHRHDHPRVITALIGGTMKIVDQDGTSEVHVWESGKSYWLPANPPGRLHTDVNAGDAPIEVIVVELKKAG
jgi:quercetin dioxygenase-like cupin family protein